MVVVVSDCEIFGRNIREGEVCRGEMMKCSQFKNSFDKYSNMPLAPGTLHSAGYSNWCDHSHSCEDCADWYQAKLVERRGFSLDIFPCVHMAYHSTFSCDMHSDPIDCPDATLIHIQSKGKYGIPVRDGGSSYIAIDYCPWCGIKL